MHLPPSLRLCAVLASLLLAGSATAQLNMNKVMACRTRAQSKKLFARMPVTHPLKQWSGDARGSYFGEAVSIKGLGECMIDYVGPVGHKKGVKISDSKLRISGITITFDPAIDNLVAALGKIGVKVDSADVRQKEISATGNAEDTSVTERYQKVDLVYPLNRKPFEVTLQTLAQSKPDSTLYVEWRYVAGITK